MLAPQSGFESTVGFTYTTARPLTVVNRAFDRVAPAVLKLRTGFTPLLTEAEAEVLVEVIDTDVDAVVEVGTEELAPGLLSGQGLQAS